MGCANKSNSLSFKDVFDFELIEQSERLQWLLLSIAIRPEDNAKLEAAQAKAKEIVCQNPVFAALMFFNISFVIAERNRRRQKPLQ